MIFETNVKIFYFTYLTQSKAVSYLNPRRDNLDLWWSKNAFALNGNPYTYTSYLILRHTQFFWRTSFENVGLDDSTIMSIHITFWNTKNSEWKKKFTRMNEWKKNLKINIQRHRWLLRLAPSTSLIYNNWQMKLMLKYKYILHCFLTNFFWIFLQLQCLRIKMCH